MLAPDGSPVEVFRQLPPPAAILDAVPPDASVLDLGCGAGRLANPLHDRGHAVLGVDLSPAMLAWVRGPTVCADIASLALHRTFGAVLLASYLVNDPRGGEFLATCRRHVADDGLVIVQRYSPDWIRDAVDDEAPAGPVTIAVAEFTRAEGDFEALVTYRIGDATWDQPIGGVILDDDAVAALAGAAGLGFDRWLDDYATWAVLRPVA